jgi:putative addiction module component (TIGR02574 family)
MKPIQVSDVLELTPAERIQLVEDIWDSVVAVPEALPLTPAQKKELDRRLAAYRQNPDAGSPWAEVKTRMLARR